MGAPFCIQDWDAKYQAQSILEKGYEDEWTVGKLMGWEGRKKIQAKQSDASICRTNSLSRLLSDQIQNLGHGQKNIEPDPVQWRGKAAGSTGHVRTLFPSGTSPDKPSSLHVHCLHS